MKYFIRCSILFAVFLFAFVVQGWAMNSTSLGLCPVVLAQSDTTVCEGTNVSLNVTQTFNSYQWSTGETTISISVTPTVTTTYSVVADDGISTCTASITITVSPVFSSTVPAAICQGDSYLLPDGSSVAAPGTYVVTLSSGAGCDSVITTNLAVNPVYSSTENPSICQGTTYLLPNGVSVGTSGSYPVTFQTIQGCDSTITTNLVVNPVYSISRNAAICQGASYTLPGGQVVSTAGVYPVTLSTGAGCDSTITTTLTVNPVYSSTINASVCQGTGYTLPNGQVVTATGNYLVTLQTVAGCDSSITTNLTVKPTYSITQNISICQGASYTLPGGQVVSTAGSYPVMLQTTGGCDSLVTTNLTVNPVFSSSVNATICQGDLYTLPNGSTASSAGTYPVTLTTTHGCDSVITTTLSVLPSYSLSSTAAVCQGDSYVLPDGQTVTTAGVYPVHLHTTLGCDSLITTTLSLLPVYSISQQADICQGENYFLPNGQLVNTAGVFPVLLFTGSGCDSMITTTLVVHPGYSHTVSASICQGSSYTLPDGQVVSTSGTYQVFYQSYYGCDSIITTILTVNPVYSIARAVSICQGSSYTLPNGQVVSTAGTYPVLLTSSAGCDSLVTVDLTIGQSITNTITASICQGQQYILPNGQIVLTSGTYPLTYTTPGGCDSTIVTLLTVFPNYSSSQNISICQGQTYILPDGQSVSSGGIYNSTLFSVHGCDSIITTDLTVHPSYRTNSSITLCQGQTITLPDGQVVGTPGTYVTAFQTVDGCDSSFSTVLTIVPPPTFSYNIDACQGETYILPDGTPITTSGTYMSTLSDPDGCDSLVFVFATFHGFPAPVINGPAAVSSLDPASYQVQNTPGHFYTWSVQGGTIQSGNGTDSIVVVWGPMGTGLVVVNESDSQCDYYDSLTVNIGPVYVPDPVKEYGILLFPNPATQHCRVEWKGNGLIREIIILDLAGRIVSATPADDNEFAVLDVSELGAGMYFVQMNGATIKATMTLMKE